MARDDTDLAQLKVRLPERLRAALEVAARDKGVSLNAEAVSQLEFSQSIQRYGAHNAKLAELVALVAASVEGEQGADWTKDELAATYVFARLRRTLAAFMGAIEDPSMLPDATGNALLDASSGAKSPEARERLVAAKELGERDEDGLLSKLDRLSLAEWRRRL